MGYFQGGPLLVKVEKINGIVNDSDIYRTGFKYDAFSLNLDIEIFREEYPSGPEEKARYIQMRVSDGVHHLFDKVAADACNQLDRVFQVVGDYDTTALEHRRPEMSSHASVGSVGQVASAGLERFSEAVLYGMGARTTHSEIDTMEVFEETDSNEGRALKLLKEKIGEKKYGHLKRYGYFAERSRHGVYRFMLNDPSGVKFIQKVDVGGKKRPITWTLCIQSSVADMPLGDIILARWMEFRADEDRFQRTANWRKVETKDEAVA